MVHWKQRISGWMFSISVVLRSSDFMSITVPFSQAISGLPLLFQRSPKYPGQVPTYLTVESLLLCCIKVMFQPEHYTKIRINVMKLLNKIQG